MRRAVAKLFALARQAYRRAPIAWRMRVGRTLRFALEPALARAVPRAAPGPFPPARSAALVGLFHAPLGHAQAARLCEAELRRDGITLTLAPADAALGLAAPSAVAEAARPAADAVIIALNPDSMVHTLAHLGPEVVRGKRVIGYWVWELETAPRRWRMLANHAVHEIWAPSRFAAQALAQVFDAPVRVAPHPAALAPPPPRTPERRARARAKRGVGEEAFVALTSFAFTSSLARKNPEGAIAAFAAAMSGRGEALLVVRHLKGGLYPEALARLRAAAAAAGPCVRLAEGGDREDLFDLYAASDVYLSLHRSEGFGLILAEAMLAGLPVMATAWSGNLDFMDADCAALIPPRALIPVHDPQHIYRQPGARWADPDLDAAVAALRGLAEDPVARAELGERGAHAARTRLAGGAAAAALRTPYPGG